MKTFSHTESELESVVNYILTASSNKSIILLYGNLGAGKTTLTKAILAQLGVTEPITSPTFNIVSSYQTPTGEQIHHFDLYRIKSIDELYEIGFEEYLDSGKLCLIEWPEIAEPLYPAEVLSVHIETTENGRNYLVE